MLRDVIQGSFPHGMPRFSEPAPVQPKAIPPRLVPLPQTAVVLPARFAGFPRAAGQPLEPRLRQCLEAAFGANFADVRVHVGREAASLGALAFTSGSDVYFAPGQYDTESERGRHLLAHELAHVVQQRTGRVRNPFGSGIAVVHDHALEDEADRLGRRAAATVQAMFMENVPARFKTGKGSVYVVEAGGTIRYKRKDESLRARPGRNIFYVDDEVGNQIETDRRNRLWQDVRVEIDAGVVTLNYTAGAEERRHLLETVPRKGLSTLDMVLDQQGRYKGVIHLGHRITSTDVSNKSLKRAQKRCKTTK